jgi:hypothetical protein
LPQGVIVRRPGEAPPGMLALMRNPTLRVRVCRACFDTRPYLAAAAAAPRSPALPAAVASAAAHQHLETAPPAGLGLPSADEVIDGPVPPPASAATHPLPPFPGPSRLDALMPVPGTMPSLASAFDALALLSAVQADAGRPDPHLSAEDNAVRVGEAVRQHTGLASQADQLQQTLQELDAYHLPPTLCGFVVVAEPAPGTLAQQHGLRPYDFLYRYGEVVITPDTQPADVAQALHRGWQADGSFDLYFYNFQSRQYRRVRIGLPAGKPHAILGVSLRFLPVAADQQRIPGLITAPSSDIYVKGWTKHDRMFVSAGANAFPLYDPLTSENRHIYALIYHYHQGMWICRNEYHPLYDYSPLTEPLYVEVWRHRNGMFIRSAGEYAELPRVR